MNAVQRKLEKLKNRCTFPWKFVKLFVTKQIVIFQQERVKSRQLEKYFSCIILLCCVVSEENHMAQSTTNKQTHTHTKLNTFS